MRSVLRNGWNGFFGVGLLRGAIVLAEEPRGTSSPIATPVSASPVTRLSRSEIDRLVALHNQARQEAGVALLHWSDDVTRFAQQRANRIAVTGKVEHRPHEGELAQTCGENLGFGSGINYGPLLAAQRWYGEKKFYQEGT